MVSYGAPSVGRDSSRFLLVGHGAGKYPQIKKNARVLKCRIPPCHGLFKISIIPAVGFESFKVLGKQGNTVFIFENFLEVFKNVMIYSCINRYSAYGKKVCTMKSLMIIGYSIQNKK